MAIKDTPEQYQQKIMQMTTDAELDEYLSSEICPGKYERYGLPTPPEDENEHQYWVNSAENEYEHCLRMEAARFYQMTMNG